jgi:hypothetical protein
MAKKKEAGPITDNGIVVDTSEIDNGLTERAKRYVFWYCYPGTDCYQHKTRAAIKAGYTKKNAVTTGYKLSKNPIIKKETERLLREYVTDSVDSMYSRYVNTLEARAFFDPADFITGTAFKPVEEIAPEKRIAIEQAVTDREGKIVAYQFGSRRAAMAEIRELRGNRYTDGGEGQDVEEIREVIIERVKLRREMRSRLPKEADYEIIDRPGGEFSEEL